MNPYSITIGRDFGSGGREIARIIADRLDCQFYDSEILALAAKESGFSEKLFAKHDEHHGRLHNLLFSKVPIIGHANYYSEQVTQGSLFRFQSEVIWHEAQNHNCVFVGRGADYVLRKHPNVLNIFIYADLDFKIRNVMQRTGLSDSEARRLILDTERTRAEYYNLYTGRQWGDKSGYHLCINSAHFGITNTAEMLVEWINSQINSTLYMSK